MASLEDPNDPNVLARGKRMREAMKYMHVLHGCALQVQASLAQITHLPASGDLPMASGYAPTDNDDIATLTYLAAALEALGAVEND